MKKRLWKRIAASIVCCMMLLTALPVMAAQPVELKNAGAVKVDADYFKDDAVLGNGKTVSLSVRKTQHVEGTDDNLGINGVVFKALRVGELYQVKLNQSATASQNSINEYTMVYGIESDFATAAGLTDKADYTFTYNQELVYGFADTTPIVEVFKENQVYPDNKNTKDKIYQYVASNRDAIKAITATTGDGTSGIATFEGVDAYGDLGLYVIVEYNVDKAVLVKADKTTERIAITKEAYPYIVSLPTLTKEDQWQTEVTVITKNKTDLADVTKKIVNNYTVGESLDEYDSLGEVLDANLVDTDTTYYGDTVEFRLKADLPKIPDTSEKSVTTFVLWDALSEGYTFTPSETTIHVNHGKDQTAMEYLEDYIVNVKTIKETTTYTDNASTKQNFGSEYIGGSLITIVFTDGGKAKLTTLSKSKDTSEDKSVYVYYTADVNQNAIVGPQGTGNPENSGNPNMVMLEYAVSGHDTTLKTDWDKVTEFTFGIDATKFLMKKVNGEDKEYRLSQNDGFEKVQFRLYKEVDNKKVYYTFTTNQDAQGKKIVGEYDVAGTAETTGGQNDSTIVSPMDNGTFTIRGLEPNTYYLQEVKTVNGYNLLKKPIEITLIGYKAHNGYTNSDDPTDADEFVGTLGKEAEENGKKTIVLADGDDNGITSLKIINTRGFQLPSTGGMGIGLFVLAGAAVVAAGIIYYVSSGKKEKKC